MKCQYCGSNRIYRSHRQGLKEGIWLRLVMKAPYRCQECGARYITYDRHHRILRRSHYQSMAEFIGLRGREQRVRQWIVTALMTLIFLAISIVFLLRTIDL